jgi:glycine/D-amino acid oxidase-like deaminating enzyme
MTSKADAVVVGGGIVGAACAYYLCAAGLNVHLVERSFPASGTSRACDGLILTWDKAPGAELALGQASAALWAELAETLDLDFEYARTGTILLAENEPALAAGQARAEAMQAAGVQAQVLDSAGLRSLEPNLAADLAGGAFFPDDAQVDARRATLALLAAAQQCGLTLHPHAEVTAIRRTNGGEGRISGVVTTAGEISTETVVCAAGVWSNEVARLAGLELPIRPRKGHILVTARVPGLIHHPLLEGGYVTTVQSAAEDLQVALVAEMTAGGTLLLGSSRQFAGFDRSVSLAVLQAIAARAARFLPALARVGVMRSYAGLRPWSPDHLPLIGPVEGVPGLYLAAGHEGAGIGLAPITGQLIAGCIAGGDLPPVADEVQPDRFELVNPSLG